MEKRESFVFYRSFADAIRKCPESERIVLYDAIIDYALDGKEPTFEGVSDLIWTLIKPQLDANWKRFINGKKGGCPTGTRKPSMIGNTNASRKPKQNQNKTKTKPNVNVNDNVNVNVNDNVFLEIEQQKEKNEKNFKWIIETWNWCVEHFASDLKKVKLLTDERRALLTALLPLGSDKVKQGIINAVRSPYLNGRTKERKRPADFDWIMRYDNFVRCVEGSL